MTPITIDAPIFVIAGSSIEYIMNEHLHFFYGRCVLYLS